MKKNAKQVYVIFWQHARKYKGLISLMLFSVVAMTAVYTAMPLYYQKFFDTLSVFSPGQGGALEKLTSILLFILLLQVTMWIFARISFFATAQFELRVMEDLANVCFVYLHGHSYRFFSNQFTGSLVRKVNRFVDGFEGVADKIYWDLLPLILRVIGVVGVLFFYNVTIGVIMFSWIVLYLGTNYVFALYKLKYDRASAEVDSETAGRLADTIANNLNIKVFSSFGDEFRWFRDLTHKQRKVANVAWNLSGVMDAVQGGFVAIIEVLIFFFAIRFWNAGIFTIGGFVLVQGYLFQLFRHLWNFGRTVRDLYRNVANSLEMTEILNTPQEVTDKPGAKELAAQRGEVEFKDVTFTYTKTREVITHFNLEIMPGEKIGLVGPSGAGKSTLIGLIFRFFDLKEGAIYIDGQNIADVTQNSLRRAIALVPQDPVLFHRTLMENIRYGRREASDAEVIEAAKQAHCHEFITQFPQGYDTYVGERGIKLSGGERQRVAIARAILKNAPILVLDEATSSLDSRSELLIQEAFSYLMRDKTTIAIAHRLSTVMKMDRIVVLKEGQIQETGKHEELLQKESGLYKTLWDLQAGGFLSA